MENYINNIVADMLKCMKANPEATPDAAWHHIMDDVTAAGVIESRKNRRDAEKFVLKALEDDELRREARNLIANAYNDWYILDTILYTTVCLTKHDEIIRKVKNRSQLVDS